MQPATNKPGYKTTEFWLSLLTAVLSAVAPAVAGYDRVTQVIGLVLSVLSVLGYTASRTSVKINSQQ